MEKALAQKAGDFIALAHKETLKKAKNIGGYTERSYREAVLSNQATIMNMLNLIVQDLVIPDAEN